MRKYSGNLSVEVLVKTLENNGVLDSCLTSEEKEYFLENMIDSVPYALHLNANEWHWKNVGYDDRDDLYVIETSDGKIFTETDAFPVEVGEEIYLFVTEY